jgi:hypothetical protein
MLKVLLLGLCPLAIDTDWLPVSSAANIRSLDVSCTFVSRLPESLSALEELRVTGCIYLDAADWLPLCIRGNLTDLDISLSSVRRVPEGLTAMTMLRANRCESLSSDPDMATWLPASSRQQLLEAVADSARLELLRHSMPSLVLTATAESEGDSSEADPSEPSASDDD